MRNLINIFAIALIAVFLSSCILEDQEPEYDVVGAVGTIATLTASSTTPAVGETVTFTLLVYSEHEPATELRMNRLQAGTATNLETRSFSNWNTEDSYRETFQFQVPQGTAGTALTIQFALVTQSNFITTRNITLNVRP
ncbi:hypothetical protein [Cecembia calidifontis]|jgi:hypothetical protein|uniref:Uncharacterized protein n=1 Tax=Cecembia calidifontis TaxID=1187080 RepID=A0A4V2F6R8_9BACT|nr:hypothetical protein [Cecembia calidifontis]RZS97269.1 hypothetical protein BC751_2873 [Cecembia calidifontis]